MTEDNALATRVPTVTADQMALIVKTVAMGATESELKLYLYDCARQGVHPLDRLLFFTKRGGKYTPITSIDLMRTRAADTGEYAGSDEPACIEGEDGGPPSKATVTVWRLVQGVRCAFTASARWMEYCPPSGQDMMWRKMPHTMLGKCAEALALRKGFPRQLAGLYAREEMDQAGIAEEAQKPVEHVNTDTGEVTPPSVPYAGTGSALVSEAQIKRLFAISRKAGWTNERLKALIIHRGFQSTKDILKSAYPAICEAIEAPVQDEMPTAEDIF